MSLSPFTGTGQTDYSQYAFAKVKINVTGNNSADFSVANKIAGFSARHHYSKTHPLSSSLWLILIKK